MDGGFGGLAGGVPEPAAPGRWLAAAVALLALLAASLAIVSTHDEFSQTADEAAHVAAGMEWLSAGRYTYERQHPPLPRIMAGLGPFLDGGTAHGLANMWHEGDRILRDGGDYARTLALARLGILPFFLVVGLVVWAWARQLCGDAGAAVAVAAFASTPPVLAHAGLATTDMAATAGLVTALFALSVWLDQPATSRRPALAALAGAAAGAAVLCKLSLLLFLPVCAAAILAWRLLPRWRPPGPATPGTALRLGGEITLAGLAAVLVLWAGYRFSLAPLTTIADRPHDAVVALFGPDGGLAELANRVVEAPVFPLLELKDGIRQVAEHNRTGHWSYLLGERRPDGWWYFFPVALLVKTPLPFLALALAGLAALMAGAWRRRAWALGAPAVAALALLAAALPSQINIGLRHLLPIYPLLAIAAGAGALWLWRWTRVPARPPVRRLRAAALAVLAVGQVAAPVAGHPDHLAYFNPLAGPHPEDVLVDSDLAWCQDVPRLADRLAALKVSRVHLAVCGALDRLALGPWETVPLQPHQRATGWIAADLLSLRSTEGYGWLEAYPPVAQVGPSIRLYHIGPPAGGRS